MFFGASAFHVLFDLINSSCLSLRYSSNPSIAGTFCAAEESGTTTTYNRKKWVRKYFTKHAESQKVSTISNMVAIIKLKSCDFETHYIGRVFHSF